jgi:phosphatidylglycerophosphate synthase
MFTKSAIFQGSINESINKKIAGLYILERNIILLSKSGIEKITIKTAEKENELFNKKILKHIKNINIEIVTGTKQVPEKNCLIISPEIFLQQHYFSNPDKYFRKKKNYYETVLSDELFMIKDKKDIIKAENLIADYIIKNTGGFIAQKINKRISIPVSRILSKTRIHPNYLTVVNMVIGFLSSYFIFLCTYDHYSTLTTYILMISGGLFFQAASILDGVDGEVAKFNLKVSKIGGWLDTFSDNTTLLLFLISNSYLFYKKMGGLISLATILVLFISLGVMLGIMINYLSKHSDSGSLVTYDREFLQKLPATDRLVKFALNMKYLTKKEMFSILFLLFAFTGHIYIIIPLTAFVLFAAAVILSLISIRYANRFR